MTYYAQINGAGVCFAVTDLAGEVNLPHLIELPGMDQSLLGKHWTGEAWTDGPTVTAVPTVVTRKQASKALIFAGLYDQVPVAIAAIADPVERALAQVDWADSPTFERDSPLLNSLAAALGLTATDLDNLFVQAAQL